jgi:hypothetical protein
MVNLQITEITSESESIDKTSRNSKETNYEELNSSRIEDKFRCEVL